jgi:hypothetical protein
MGIIRGREDSSEPGFLLVANYNYWRSWWSSDRQGIFGQSRFVGYFFLFIEISSYCWILKEETFNSYFVVDDSSIFFSCW